MFWIYFDDMALRVSVALLSSRNNLSLLEKQRSELIFPIEITPTC